MKKMRKLKAFLATILLNPSTASQIPETVEIGNIGDTKTVSCDIPACSEGRANWVWRPSEYNGWGFDCLSRDQTGKCRWDWGRGRDDSFNSWRTIEQLDNVLVGERHELTILEMGLKDNRVYGLVDPMTGAELKVVTVKVGEAPSFPSDIECITHLDQMTMNCKWELGEKALLPWARTKSYLKYTTTIIDKMQEAETYKLEFSDSDVLLPCPSPCDSGSQGCCNFKLELNDIILNPARTYRFEITSENLFGRMVMQKGNSKIIHVTPSQKIQPLSPEIKSIRSPNQYDGSSLMVEVQPINYTQSVGEPVYQHKAEFRVQGTLDWQSTGSDSTDLVLELSKLLPFHVYEIRVCRRPAFGGFWSEPSEISLYQTLPVEPTLALAPKYTILSKSNSKSKIKFFWPPYYQRNAANTTISLRIDGNDCNLDESINRRLFNDVIGIEQTEKIVELDTFKCLEATFTIFNEKGHLESPLLTINLEQVNALAPSIDITTGEIGDLTIDFENEEIGLGNKWNDASIYVCFSREGDSKAEPETCHRQDVRESDFPVRSKAVLTPCYNYNVYLQVGEGAISLRSTPKKIQSNGAFNMNIGAIGDIIDLSSKSGPEIEVIYEVNKSAAMIYDMHPVVSFKNHKSDFVYHKKIDPKLTTVKLVEDDGIIGGGDVEVWLSLCCDEDLASCHAHTEPQKLSLRAGKPGAVTDLSMIWNNELSGYELQWTNPLRSNARITGYHVIVHYSYPAHAKSTSGSQSAIGEETVYLSSQEFNHFSLLEACSNIFDSVNVTIAAYGTGDESSMIPGKPTDYQFDCADMMIVGLSIGILIAIGLLAVTLIVMLVLSYVKRRELKTYVTAVVWPEIEKPSYITIPSSRDDSSFGSKQQNDDDEDEDRLLLPKNVRKTSEGIIEADVKIQKIPDQKNENADSGVSGSEYSGSEKSVPIYSLSNGLSNHYRGLLDFNRRGSQASSGISSGGNSFRSGNSGNSGRPSVVSSNHSGDSVLAKSNHGSNKIGFAFPDLKLPMMMSPAHMDITEPYPAPIGYSIMDSNFGLKSRPANMNDQLNYVTHGYVENQVFNMQNMPTAFLESFKLMKSEIANLDSPDPYYPSSNGHRQTYSDGYSDEPLYKPMSVLIPPKNISHLPVIDQHDGYGKSPQFMSFLNAQPMKNQPMKNQMRFPPFGGSIGSNGISIGYSSDEYTTGAKFLPTHGHTDYAPFHRHTSLPGPFDNIKKSFPMTNYNTNTNSNNPSPTQPLSKGGVVGPDGYTLDNDGYNAAVLDQLQPNADGYVEDNVLPTAFTPLAMAKCQQPPQMMAPQVSGYLPFDRAMRTFGIDESSITKDEYLLSSRLAALHNPPMIENMIPVSYVSEYTTDMFIPSTQNKIIPGYVSIEGAQLLQQS